MNAERGDCRVRVGLGEEMGDCHVIDGWMAWKQLVARDIYHVATIRFATVNMARWR